MSSVPLSNVPLLASEHEPTTLGLVEWLLKSPERVDQFNRQARWQRELFPRFLLIALVSYLAYASVLVVLFDLAPAAAYPRNPWLALPAASWTNGSAWTLPAAFAAGMVLAACVCLPAFYFYSLLAGVHLTWLQITSVIGKGMAANSILLLGLTPIYVIVALGGIIMEFPASTLQMILSVGLVLPFAAGLWGLRAIYMGIIDVTTSLPNEWQCRRYCFLRRLMISWTALYAAVVPIMIYRLWELFAG